MFSTANSHLRVNKSFRSIFRSDTGATKIPAAHDIETYLKSQTSGLIKSKNEQLIPSLGTKLRTCRNLAITTLVIASGIKNHGPDKMTRLHGFQFFGNSFLT